MAREFSDFGAAVCSGVPLSTLTSFHIGGPADYFIEPGSIDELARLVERCADLEVPFCVIGAGSNLLVADAGLHAAVFRLSRMDRIERRGTRILCEAGTPLQRLVWQAEQWALSGLEPLAGIPGTVGGAIAMNAGGQTGCVAETIVSVTTIDRTGAVRPRTPEDLAMGYRHSLLKPEIAIAATFELAEADGSEIADRRQAVLAEKTLTQPLAAQSAGCVFKNPPGQSAGALIDRAGLKGERVGPAVVSGQHANFIINQGGATARDVLQLIRRVRRRIRKRFGVDLELEIELWN